MKKGCAMKNIWMKITNDEYELPLAVADTAQELADIVGTTKNCIVSTISKFNKGKLKRTHYICVKVKDE